MVEKLELSLIVCVANDVRIKKLLDTIDCYCEVIVVLNGATKEVKEIVESYLESDFFHLVILEMKERNLSKARNVGTEVASNCKVVFYDSDCEIIKGALKKFSSMLDRFLVVDGKVAFKADNFQSKVVSVTREMGIPGYALCPAIGINKKIKESINGYFFDSNICWIEDFEFNLRAKKKKIDIGYIQDITCKHDNLTFCQDLKSAYRYGTGERKAVKKGVYKKGPDANWDIIIPIAKKNILSGIYYVLWNIIYCIGYFTNFKI